MKKSLISLLMLAICVSSFAQIEVASFLNLTKEGVKDIEKLTEAYLTPLGRGFATSLSSGWHNTARVHRLLGFDLSVGMTLTTIPDENKRFNLKDYNWNVLRYNVPNPVTPTVAGKQTTRPQVGIALPLTANDTAIISNLFTMPQGANLPFVLLPIAHFGLGVGIGTDIQARVLPPLTISDYGSIDMWGIGIKHDFKRWIPVVKNLPFDASIAVNYSRVNSVFSKFNYFPTKMLTIDRQYIDNTLLSLVDSDSRIQAEYYDKQNLELHMKSFSANLIVSKKLLFLTVYGSMGYSSSDFGIQLKGDYLLPTLEMAGSLPVIALREAGRMKDPIDIKIKHSSIRAGLGARINLAVITLHGDVTFQDYLMYNFGLGVSIR